MRLVSTLPLIWLLVVPQYGAAASCPYLPRRLTGFADVGGSRFVRLDVDIEFGGADCEVEISGRGRCRPVARRALGVEFALRGRCPGRTFVIRDASYVRRQNERIADVMLDLEFEDGARCHITGTTPSLYFSSPFFGGPMPSLSGEIICPTSERTHAIVEIVSQRGARAR